MSCGVSILLPIYNGESYLPAALDSLCASSLKAVDAVIAVDDGSTDRSLDILRSYEDRLPLRILAPERTGSWTRNTNLAAGEARSEYLCFLHQDDTWLPGRGEWLEQVLSSSPSPDFAVSSALFLDPAGKAAGAWSLPFKKGTAFTLEADEALRALLIQNFFAIGAPVFRRDRFLAFGGLDPELPYTADWNLWLRFAAEAGNISCTSTPTVGFRVHPESQTISMSGTADTFRHQLESVRSRFETALADSPASRNWIAASRLSLEVNCLLAASHHQKRNPLPALCGLLLRTPPPVWRLFFRYSRIRERIGSRLFLSQKKEKPS